MRYDKGICFFAEGSQKYQSFHDLINDLNFGTILSYMALEEKEDIPWIADVISFPVLEDKELEKRQALIRCLCNRTEIIEEAYPLIRDSHKRYTNVFKLVENGKRDLEKCGSTVSSCVEMIQCLTDFVSSLQKIIEKNNLKDIREFSMLCDSFSANGDSPFCSEMASNIDAYKKKGALTLQVSLGEGYKISEVLFESIDSNTKNRGLGFLFKNKDDIVKYKDDYVCASGMNLADYFLVNVVKENWTEFRKWNESFHRLRRQSAFLYGCVKMYQRGMERGFYFSYPHLNVKEQKMVGLYELSLAFQTSDFPIDNDILLTNKKGLVVTGANQGGKSTFLRSLGIAQLMFQAGMYVPAKQYSQRKYKQIFSHFTRREDSAMNTGRFEEELKRMEYILQNIKEPSLIISNETFCGTTEVTAAQVAMSIVEGIADYDINLWMVTHISQFAINLYKKDRDNYVFLSAAHAGGGQERFKMILKEPDNTSFGMELFQKIILEE